MHALFSHVDYLNICATNINTHITYQIHIYSVPGLTQKLSDMRVWAYGSKGNATYKTMSNLSNVNINSLSSINNINLSSINAKYKNKNFNKKLLEPLASSAAMMVLVPAEPQWNRPATVAAERAGR